MLKGVEIVEFTSDGKGIPIKGPKLDQDSNSEGEDDPMVSSPLILVMISVELTVVSLGCRSMMTALFYLVAPIA